jgi:hypothetical protein
MDFEHGTLSGYNNHRCRCELCTRAKNNWSLWNRMDLKATELTIYQHGTPNSYYNYKCRCRFCKDAAKAYRKRKK